MRAVTLARDLSSAMLALLLGVAGSSCGAVAAVVAAPYAVAQSGPAPTVEGEEAAELCDGLHGTLVAADESGRTTLVDLPTLRTTQVDLDGSPVCVSGPDDFGRIAYVARYTPWHQLVLGFLLGIGRERAALRVQSALGHEGVELASMSEHAAHGLQVQLSRRGGRVLLFRRARVLRVFDIERGELFRRDARSPLIRAAWLDDDGATLHFEERASNVGGVPIGDLSAARWRSVRIDLATGEVRETDDDGASATRAVRPYRWSERAYRAPTTAESDERVDDLGLTQLEFEDGRRIYPGLSRPDARARGFLSFQAPAFEHALRLGERDGTRTRTLVPRVALGAWTFSEVRLAP